MVRSEDYVSGFQPLHGSATVTQAFSTPASKLAGDPGFGLGWYVVGPLALGRLLHSDTQFALTTSN